MHKTPLTPLEHDGLKAHGLDIGTPSQLSDCFRHGVKWAQDNAVPQWIPVSERMPEYGVAVFVVIDGIFKLIPFKRVCFGGVWWWESVISSTCMLYDISDVTHWMPLPSAPEQNK
jgi:hypothetical protein